MARAKEELIDQEDKRSLCACNEEIGKVTSLTNLNPYLLLRDAKIARNNGRLKRLGLAITNNANTFSGLNRTARDHSITKPGVPLNVSLRRSSRLRHRPAVLQNQFSLIVRHQKAYSKDSNTDPVTKRRRKQKIGEELESNSGNFNLISSERSLLEKETESGFTRSTGINVDTLLFGKLSCHDAENTRMIGRQLKSTGKSAVVCVAALCNLSITSSFKVETLRFNKYSGICEWKNDTIFLWVNIGGPNSVKNEFLFGGKQITWFGGSRMHEHTPSIQNLLRIGMMATNQQLTAESGIVLWCRAYDEKRRTFQPYMCLGRVGYNYHDPKAHPIKFVWNLLDHETLIKMENDSIKENAFKQIMTRATL